MCVPVIKCYRLLPLAGTPDPRYRLALPLSPYRASPPCRCYFLAPPLTITVYSCIGWLCSEITVNNAAAADDEDDKHFQSAGPSLSGDEGTFDESPLLVHCGTGVSRSGVFIAIDYSLMKAKQENCVNVYRFEHFVLSDLNHIWHVGWPLDVFLKYEFRIGRCPNFGATDSKNRPFPLTRLIAYTPACSYRPSCDVRTQSHMVIRGVGA